MPETDAERLRWEGAIEARVSDAERRLDAVNGSIKTHAEATNNLALTVGGLATKLSIYTALASLAGGGLVSVAVFFITK